MKNRINNQIDSNDRATIPDTFFVALERGEGVWGDGLYGRRSLREEPASVPVDAATFSELLISKRDLTRSDLPGSNQLGLFDSRSGVRYVINESELYLAIH